MLRRTVDVLRKDGIPSPPMMSTAGFFGATVPLPLARSGTAVSDIGAGGDYCREGDLWSSFES